VGGVAAELLAELGSVLGRTDLTYAEPPVRLTGGFFTENHAFRLAGAPAPWDARLVLRLFPHSMPDDAVVRETEVQRGLASAGYPTPNVLAFDDNRRIDRRRYLVMEFMDGAPLMSGITPGKLIHDLPVLLRQLPKVMAEKQVELHAVDPDPIAARLEGVTSTVERWFTTLQYLVDHGGDGFADAHRWLVEHRPADRGPLVWCHGDLNPANVLADENGNVTAVLDWTVATLAEPALDIGFNTMALALAPVDAPKPLPAVARWAGRGIARRYVRHYLARSDIDLTNQRYYEALRCAVEVGNAAGYRIAPRELRPTWDSVADVMVRYFRERTGVTITMPAPAS
jgi:aminoglycoside phosphotransferase (APT) family kinase protein